MGYPLIYYSINPAKQSKFIDDIYVSSEDADIKKISREMGATIIDRPDHLSQDGITADQVMKHAITFMQCNDDDIIIYMQPTDLFKNAIWIDECIEGLCSGSYSSSFIACSEHKNFWTTSAEGVQRITGKENYADRQVKNPIYREDTGLGSAIWAETIFAGKRVGDNPFIITKNYRFFDVHNRMDIELAETYLKHEHYYIP